MQKCMPGCTQFLDFVAILSTIFEITYNDNHYSYVRNVCFLFEKILLTFFEVLNKKWYLTERNEKKEMSHE
jgi:hypothetical protein